MGRIGQKRGKRKVEDKRPKKERMIRSRIVPICHERERGRERKRERERMKSALWERGREEARTGKNGGEAKVWGDQWGGFGCGSAVVEVRGRGGHHRLGRSVMDCGVRTV